DQLRDEPCPTRLVAGTEAGSVVAVEVLVEEDVVPPRRIVLKTLDPAEAGAPAVGAADEERDQPFAEVVGDLLQRVLVAGSRRILELELVSEEAGIPRERLDDEEVHGHPDRPAPVRVAAEHPRGRLRGLVVDRRLRAVDVENERMTRERARD